MSSKFTILEDFNFGPTPSKQNDLSQYDPKDQIRKDVSNLFKDFIMVKTNQYDSFGVYKAKVDCMLCVGGTRYIVAIVENDNEMVGSKRPLKDLHWNVFQTRYSDNYDELRGISLPARSYQVPSQTSSINDKIKKWFEVRGSENKQGKTVYKPESVPVLIEILHLKESDSFADKGTILSSLELFQTILIIEN
jgi:hypothetical protein